MAWIEKIFGGRETDNSAKTPTVLPSKTPDFVVVDVETSCSRTSSICQIGIVGFTNSEVSFEYETLIDPCDEFHPFNVSVHGIEQHHVRGKPRFASLHPTIAEHLFNRVTVAHSSFDRRALSTACLAHGKPEIATRWLDSVKMARHAWPHLSSHRLNVLADHLGISLQHHDARSDARAAGLVVVKAIEHTGIDLEDWFSVPTQRAPKVAASIKRAATADGPLSGECIAVTGELTSSRSAFADAIAAAGGSVSPSPNKRTTILVLGIQDPSSFAGKTKSSKHLKVEELQASGQAIEILTEQQLQRRMSLETAS